jgi:hypothetical protein
MQKRAGQLRRIVSAEGEPNCNTLRKSIEPRPLPARRFVTLNLFMVRQNQLEQVIRRTHISEICEIPLELSAQVQRRQKLDGFPVAVAELLQARSNHWMTTEFRRRHRARTVNRGQVPQPLERAKEDLTEMLIGANGVEPGLELRRGAFSNFTQSFALILDSRQRSERRHYLTSQWHGGIEKPLL